MVVDYPGKQDSRTLAGKKINEFSRKIPVTGLQGSRRELIMKIANSKKSDQIIDSSDNVICDQYISVVHALL